MSLASTPQRALLSMVWQRLKIRLRGLRFVERRADEVKPADLMKIDTCWSVAMGLGIVDNIRGADFQGRHLLLALDAGEPYRIARALSMNPPIRVPRQPGYALPNLGRLLQRDRLEWR